MGNQEQISSCVTDPPELDVLDFIANLIEISYGVKHLSCDCIWISSNFLCLSCDLIWILTGFFMWFLYFDCGFYISFNVGCYMSLDVGIYMTTNVAFRMLRMSQMTTSVVVYHGTNVAKDYKGD